MEVASAGTAQNGNSQTFRWGASKNKRKRDREADAANKKRITDNSRSTKDDDPTASETSNQTSEMSTLPTSPLDSLKASLKGKFELAQISIVSSHKIEKRVTLILKHLARFSWTDMAVLPGVVFTVAREKDIGKLASVIEIAKRQIHEDDQKWYQYNGLYHVEKSEHPSVIEETKMEGMGGEKEQAEEDVDKDDSEIMGSGTKHDHDGDLVMPDRFLDAVDPKPDSEAQLFMAIFLTRVPIPELKSHPDFTMQTNEVVIDRARAKRNGGV